MVCILQVYLANSRTISDNTHFSTVGIVGHTKIHLDSTVVGQDRSAPQGIKQFTDVATIKTLGMKESTKLASEPLFAPHNVLTIDTFKPGRNFQTHIAQENTKVPFSEKSKNVPNHSTNELLLGLNMNGNRDVLSDIIIKPGLKDMWKDSGKYFWNLYLCYAMWKNVSLGKHPGGQVFSRPWARIPLETEFSSGLHGALLHSLKFIITLRSSRYD